MLSRSNFEKIQRETGFNLDLLEKVYHLTRVLNEIQESEVMRDNLTLKGGTALNFLYLDISRLSIDIDFNFTGKIAKEDMIEIRPAIKKAIISLGENLGYDVEESSSSYILSRHRLRYTTIRGTKDHIKIEINYLDRLPIGDIVTRNFPSIFPDITLFPLTTYSLEEIAAQKTKACIERTEPRDIFDLYSLSKQKMILEKARQYASVYYCMCKESKTKDILKKIEENDLEKIEQEIRQFIRNVDKFDAEKIQKDAVDFLGQILSFTEKEQDFIDTFYKKRKIVPETLFKNKSMIAKHPALLYRLDAMG